MKSEGMCLPGRLKTRLSKSPLLTCQTSLIVSMAYGSYFCGRGHPPWDPTTLSPPRRRLARSRTLSLDNVPPQCACVHRYILFWKFLDS
jgi:hypothetical protein